MTTGLAVRPGGHAVEETGCRPAVDLTRLGLAALATVAVSAVAASAAVALRRPPAIGSVSMGPGGWVSLKRTGAPPLRDGTPRPWWARLLRARRLVVQR
ncbi:hypothetical protein [Jidongwangia harbinensis]|uniref:hypothetical protein n=1 Tax=Jidongwangia harbinensis TaxID=2878561 RepID=UPI001CD9A479|nr:hypothetical protein [Jidongwangia harbinensis]MCA2216663.1 hypothetical protein [Jidongwangia harbinensis]